MPKKKIKKIVEAGFIPGIYNYCDRWCEHCNQRLLCMSYVMGKRLEEKGEFNLDRDSVRSDDNAWTRLKNIFESTYEILRDLAAEHGVNVEDIYAAENIDKEFWGEDFEDIADRKSDFPSIEMSDIIRMCMIYENLTDKCLEENIFEALDERKKEVGNDPVVEALDVVSWYVDMIQAKMRRALYGYYYSFSKKTKLNDDYNGSAKVALISIDRSIESWKVLKEYFPENQRDIRHLLVILQQIVVDIEKKFPDARTFLRPGFESPACEWEVKDEE